MSRDRDNSKIVVPPGNSSSKQNQTGSDEKCRDTALLNQTQLAACDCAVSCDWDNSKIVVPPGNSSSKPNQTGSDEKCVKHSVKNA